jgi:hypothetical protein
VEDFRELAERDERQLEDHGDGDRSVVLDHYGGHPGGGVFTARIARSGTAPLQWSSRPMLAAIIA